MLRAVAFLAIPLYNVLYHMATWPGQPGGARAAARVPTAADVPPEGAGAEAPGRGSEDNGGQHEHA